MLKHGVVLSLLLAASLLLSGCIGGLPNLVPEFVSVYDLEILEAGEDGVLVQGFVKNTSINNNYIVSVTIELWLTDENGVRLAETSYSVENGLESIYPKGDDIRRFEANLPYSDQWNGELPKFRYTVQD